MTNWYQSFVPEELKVVLRKTQNQLQEQLVQSMAGMAEQNQGMNNMMKQILDGFNELKANHIKTREALRAIQART